MSKLVYQLFGAFVRVGFLICALWAIFKTHDIHLALMFFIASIVMGIQSDLDEIKKS